MPGFKGCIGSLVARAIKRPVATVILTLTVVILGMLALGSLSVNLLPDIFHPEIYVRVSEPGVPVELMEERVTRQLEKQLAITGEVTSVDSTTIEGSSVVRLGFKYDKDMDAALRDASSLLDRARHFLPKTIDPPTIYKLDPSQRPVMEYFISTADKSSVGLRDWAEHVFAHWFYNIPGVAAVEVGGGLEREVRVLPDQKKLAGMGLTVANIVQALNEYNINKHAWQVGLSDLGYGSRTEGRLSTISQLEAVPIPLAKNGTARLDEVARIEDRHDKETLRVRFNGVPGVKVSIQKGPQANTVEVVNHIKARLGWLEANQLISTGVVVNKVADRSVYIRDSLRNTAWALLSGAVLALLVVWLFIGSWRYTLIIGSVIPVSILVSFVVMQLSGLSLNIMTLGGLALAVGMLVNSTIVMAENISRQRAINDRSPKLAGQQAAAEANGPIIASVLTTLATALSFLLIGGLAGLLFRELILIITVAMAASTVIALTLVPSLAVRARPLSGQGQVDRILKRLADGYVWLLGKLITLRWLVIGLAVIGSLLAGWQIGTDKSGFLPSMDNGQVYIHLKADAGISVDGTDRKVALVEELIRRQPYVDGVFTATGSWVFGRTRRDAPNTASIQVQLVPRGERPETSVQWAKNFSNSVAETNIAGLKVYAHASDIPGIGTRDSNQGVSLKIQGPDLDQLARLADQAVEKLAAHPGLQNPQHNLQDVGQEYVIDIDHAKAVDMGMDMAEISRQIRTAMSGVDAGELTDGDQIWPVHVMLPREELNSPESLSSLLIEGETKGHPAVRLGDVAAVRLQPAPAEIRHENQRRTVEITASLSRGYILGKVTQIIRETMAQVRLPGGYHYFLGNSASALELVRSRAPLLFVLALFLVFVVLAVQSKSLLNPLTILLSVPVSLIGVAIGLKITGMAVTIPVWLGMIMLVGIVVNNAILLVEYIQHLYASSGQLLDSALLAARLRPILMTTLATVAGMSPLAAGLGEGAELLQPLAVTVISGLSFAVLVNLILVPLLYYQFHQGVQHPRENRAK